MTAHDIFSKAVFVTARTRWNGISLHSAVGGAGPAVLFLHGWPADLVGMAMRHAGVS